MGQRGEGTSRSQDGSTLTKDPAPALSFFYFLSLEVILRSHSSCSTTTNRDKGDGLTAPAMGFQIQPVQGLLRKIF